MVAKGKDRSRSSRQVRFRGKGLMVMWAGLLVVSWLLGCADEAAISPQSSELPLAPSNGNAPTEGAWLAGTADVDNRQAEEAVGQEQDADAQRAVRLEAMTNVPPLRWRTELTERMRTESIVETIERLPDADGMLFADIAPGVEGPDLSAAYQTAIVVRSPRVRKLYVCSEEERRSVITELRRVQRDWLVMWPEAVAERRERRKQAEGPLMMPDRRYAAMQQCLAATYLLAEFGDYDALPVLAQQYKLCDLSSSPFMPPVVAASITFYAMHRLASSYPRERLSRQASDALDEYLRAAAEHVPPPEQMKVTVWDASHSESDPRFLFIGYRQEVLEGQGSMVMPVYPTNFSDGTRMENTDGTVRSERLEMLFEKLDAFVTLAYPADN